MGTEKALAAGLVQWIVRVSQVATHGAPGERRSLVVTARWRRRSQESDISTRHHPHHAMSCSLRGSNCELPVNRMIPRIPVSASCTGCSSEDVCAFAWDPHNVTSRTDFVTERFFLDFISGPACDEPPLLP